MIGFGISVHWYGVNVFFMISKARGLCAFSYSLPKWISLPNVSQMLGR